MKIGTLKLTATPEPLAFAAACSSTRTQQSAGQVIDDSVLTSKVKVARRPSSQRTRDQAEVIIPITFRSRRR